ncbi:MAG: FlgO family outer membrane protein [Magnetococcus sp. THC-1_WYH]
MIRLFLILPVMGLGLLVGGCLPEMASYPLVSQPLSVYQAPDVKLAVYQAADAMMISIQEKVHKRATILPASFVDEQNMDETTPLGRMLSRQMAGRFTQSGYKVLEVKLRNNLLLQKGKGQFLLSEELSKIRETNEAHLVLAGSYSVAKNRVFVSTQLIRISDGVTLAAEDFSMEMTPDVRKLLGVSQF